MNMRIDPARHHNLTRSVDDPCGADIRKGTRRPDRCNLPATYADVGKLRIAARHHHLAARHNQIEHARLLLPSAQIHLDGVPIQLLMPGLGSAQLQILLAGIGPAIHAFRPWPDTLSKTWVAGPS